MVNNIKVGFVHDFTDNVHPGGAQQTNRVILDSAPDNFIITEVTPEKFDLTSDVFILNNIRTFTKEQVLVLLSKPHINWFHDIVPCPNQNSRVKGNALVNIFLSELLRNEYEKRLGLTSASYIIPSAIDVDKFIPFKEVKKVEDNFLYLGDIQPHKGIDNVLLEARRQGVKVDFWGFGNQQILQQIKHSAYGELKGFCPPDKVAEIMATYKTFIHLPSDVEGFGRAVMEAYLVGCETIVNYNVGCKTFVGKHGFEYEEVVRKLREVPKMFWSLIEEVTSEKN